MAMPIRILPPEIASQIAAGEVVERPASVVKELIENALDASATHIAVTIAGAGKSVIEVADDGDGIPAEELPIAVERHATSKIQSAAELFQIATLGFRGEALASIGSVSRLTLTSRWREAQVGRRLVVDGGLASEPQPVGAPVGTVVRVEDLFYNVPARLKFLKSDTTERRQIDDLVTRYAFAYPHIRFHLSQDGRVGLQTSGNGDRREVLATLYGVDVARQMLAVHFEDERLTISGFISPTSLTRSNRRDILFYVNGRPVREVALTSAVVQAYHTMLMVGRYPLAALYIELPPVEVDVNVHPTKAEVRFRDPGGVFAAVQRAVRRALLAYAPVPRLSGDDTWVHPAEEFPFDHRQLWAQRDMKAGLPGSPAEDGSIPPFDRQGRPELFERTPILRLVGQIAAAYLVAEGPDGLYLIDQHAAHERVLFEKYMAQRPGAIPSQTLLQPHTIELPPGDARLLEENLPILGGLGFQIEPFGRHSYLVRSIPQIIAGMDPTAALRVLVEDFEEDETPLAAQVEARIIARVCKRAAIKAGQVLSDEEQRALLRDLEACESPRTCPHGRPTMIHLSVDLLERQFGRRGPR